MKSCNSYLNLPNDEVGVALSRNNNWLASFRTLLLRACFMLLAGYFVVCMPSAILVGQDAADADGTSERIYKKEPYDQITLDPGNRNEVLKVKPIPFPNRRVPAKPKAGEKLRVKLFDDDREFEIGWQHIVKLELFEQLIVGEVNRLVSEKKLDEAYDHLAFLLSEYPEVEGLKDAQAGYLYQSAGIAFRQQKYPEALGVLEELHNVNPTYRQGANSPTLMQLIGNVTDKLVEGYLKKEDYRSTRTLLSRLEKAYNAKDEPFLQKWRNDLVGKASKFRDDAKQMIAAKQFAEAHDACAAMNRIWSEVEGGPEVCRELATLYPVVTVGAAHGALVPDPRSLQSHAARRVGRLLQRRLLEFRSMGPEGGQYASPLGSVTRSDDGMQLTLQIRPEMLLPGRKTSGYDVARHLLEIADPKQDSYQANWARLLSQVRVKSIGMVEVDLRVPHVLPEPFLQTDFLRVGSVEPSPGEPGSGPYVMLGKTDTSARYATNPQYSFTQPGQPGEVVEKYYDDPQRGLLALERGEVDVLDQVFPGDVASLASVPEIVVAKYAAPTTHLLYVNAEHPYLAMRTFRRALVYGSNRQIILQSAILKDTAFPGFRLVSGPFPAPVDGADAKAYGYDDRIEVRPYDPALGLTLKMLAQREIKIDSERQNVQVPPLTPIVIGHPADEVSRIACKALARQWKAMGIECKLQQFAPGVTDDPKLECHLVYAQIAAWEPVVDASRLFGEDGLISTENPFVRLSLRQLEAAKNWPEARRSLQTLHRLIHEDVTIIPLWQTFDHYAYRKSMVGPGAAHVNLYQDVEQWKLIAPAVAPQ